MTTYNKHLDRLIQHDRARGTRKQYDAAYKRIVKFAKGKPIDDELVARYIAHITPTLTAASGVAIAIAAVKDHARRQAVDDPTGTLTDRASRGARRLLAQKPSRGQVYGISWQETAAMVKHSRQDKGDIIGVRNAAIFQVMSDCLLRINEVVNLRHSDIVLSKADEGLITIRSSKTDQYGKGAPLYLSAAAADLLDLLILQKTVMQGVAPDGEALVFCGLHPDGRLRDEGIPMDHGHLRDIIKATARAVGITARVGGHSFRVGTAIELARQGISTIQIMQAGRWKSADTVAGYIKATKAELGAVATLKKQSNKEAPNE